MWDCHMCETIGKIIINDINGFDLRINDTNMFANKCMKTIEMYTKKNIREL